MSAQRLFIIFLVSFIALGVLWFSFIYSPLQIDETNAKIRFEEVSSKLKYARRDLGMIENRLDKKKEALADVKTRIVDRKNLSNITEALRNRAQDFKLEITDFTPVLENYFETTGNSQVKPLPLVITVSGRYLQIGKFIESWDNLNFYLTVHEIIVEKLDVHSNELTATITCNLYTWNS